MANSDSFPDNCAVVVSSFDGFVDLWHPFFTLLFRHWPDCPFPIYLISNTKEYFDPRVTTINIGEDKQWASNLLIALEQISAKYILYMQDDYFLQSKVDTGYLQKLVEYAKQHHIACLRLFPEPAPDASFENNLGLGLIAPGAPYRVSLQSDDI